MLFISHAKMMIYGLKVKILEYYIKKLKDYVKG